MFNSTFPVTTGQLLDNVLPEQQAQYASYFRAVHWSIESGVVASNHKERRKYWADWYKFAANC